MHIDFGGFFIFANKQIGLNLRNWGVEGLPGKKHLIRSLATKHWVFGSLGAVAQQV